MNIILRTSYECATYSSDAMELQDWWLSRLGYVTYHSVSDMQINGTENETQGKTFFPTRNSKYGLAYILWSPLVFLYQGIGGIISLKSTVVAKHQNDRKCKVVAFV